VSGYIWLIIASTVFVGSHFAMSHSFRKIMVRSFGKSGFLGVYSLLSFAAFAGMVHAFIGVPKYSALWQSGDIIWGVSSVITLIAAVLFTGSLIGNPSLPSPASADLAMKMPTGVFKVTRHPMMWSFALWGFAHILIAPRPDVLIFIGSIIFLALVGAKAQEAKKSGLMGVEWEMWLRRTSFLPRLSGFARIPVLNWAIGIIVWLAATWAHSHFAVPAAGLFRWFHLS
jgi:uncharacterized membrane protein